MGRVRGEVRLAEQTPTVILYYCHTPPMGLRWQQGCAMKLLIESFGQGHYSMTIKSWVTTLFLIVI